MASLSATPWDLKSKPMSTDRPKRDAMSLDEVTISNMWEIAAIVELV